MNQEKNNSSNPTERGFSLLDVLASFFILIVLIGLFSQAFLNIAAKYQLQRAVWEIYSSLNYARYRSIFYGLKVRARFDSGICTIEIYDINLGEWKAVQSSLLEGVTLKANNSPIFHPRGTVSNLASIYISNSWGKYKITLAISGRIKASKL